MGLSQPPNQSYGFDRLTRVKSDNFVFIFSIRLYLSDDSGHRFDKLTQVVFVLFLIDFIFNLIL
jgi:hypothetical protein